MENSNRKEATEMEYRDMIEQIRGLPIIQLQEQSDTFFGAVMATAEFGHLESLLNGFFGQPIKPPQTKATPEVAQITEPHGGIRENQTLYFRKGCQNRSILAMIWPWNDGSNFTLKIFQDIIDTGQ